MKPIHIVGGGLAGLTLGIHLRGCDVPVVVSEKGAYPRHRVCGEFVSGRGKLLLEAMGVNQALLRRGARLARTAQFFSGAKVYPPRALPEPALCVSRYELDAMLAEQFVALRGDCERAISCAVAIPTLVSCGRQAAGRKRWTIPARSGLG